jgi:hypothetical protein
MRPCCKTALSTRLTSQGCAGRYATKWAEYHLGDIELPEVTTSPIEVTTRPTDDDDRQDMFLERHRLGIASYFDIDPDAVNISVDLVYRDKDGVLRTAFK